MLLNIFHVFQSIIANIHFLFFRKAIHYAAVPDERLVWKEEKKNVGIQRIKKNSRLDLGETRARKSK